jgi:hypothetical protein
MGIPTFFGYGNGPVIANAKIDSSRVGQPPRYTSLYKVYLEQINVLLESGNQAAT